MTFGTVQRAFATPSNGPSGLEFDGHRLWYADYVSDSIYQLDPWTGTVVRTIVTSQTDPLSLAWEGQGFYVGYNNGNIVWFNPWTGTDVRPIVNFQAHGMTWDGNSLWTVNSVTNLISQLVTDTGTVKRSFPAPGTNSCGLATDGHILYHCSANLNLIYKIDIETMTVIDLVAGTGTPVRLAWGGCALWLLDNSGMIYLISVN